MHVSWDLISGSLASSPACPIKFHLLSIVKKFIWTHLILKSSHFLTKSSSMFIAISFLISLMFSLFKCRCVIFHVPKMMVQTSKVRFWHKHNEYIKWKLQNRILSSYYYLFKCSGEKNASSKQAALTSAEYILYAFQFCLSTWG